jgi:predicted XRE-type DNA-binding protein
VELPVLLAAFRELDLSAYRHVSLHFPSAYPADREATLVRSLRQVGEGIPVVVHPDAIGNCDLWRDLGASLLVENMDRRKSEGRTVRELWRIFERLPDARLCFDVAHARQVDTSLTEARPSSGNLFRDLGFAPEEAEHLRVRSTLMAAVRRYIDERGLTQAEAAEILGVTQPRISNLVRGKIDLFSIDTLVAMLARAGIHVDIVVNHGQLDAA